MANYVEIRCPFNATQMVNTRLRAQVLFRLQDLDVPCQEIEPLLKADVSQIVFDFWAGKALLTVRHNPHRLYLQHNYNPTP